MRMDLELPWYWSARRTQDPLHCFGFSVSNNKVEYETFIVGLHLAKELGAHNLKICNESQLVVNQVNDIYMKKGETMVAYLEK